MPSFRASRGLTQPDRNHGLSRIDELARLFNPVGYDRDSLKKRIVCQPAGAFEDVEGKVTGRSGCSLAPCCWWVAEMTHLSIGTYGAIGCQLAFTERCRSDGLCGGSHKVPVLSEAGLLMKNVREHLPGGLPISW